MAPTAAPRPTTFAKILNISGAIRYMRYHTYIDRASIAMVPPYNNPPATRDAAAEVSKSPVSRPKGCADSASNSSRQRSCRGQVTPSTSPLLR